MSAATLNGPQPWWSPSQLAAFLRERCPGCAALVTGRQTRFFQRPLDRLGVTDADLIAAHRAGGAGHEVFYAR